MSLTGKVAIVTGSSRSIGAEIARQLGADGASVVVNYNGSVAAAEKVVEEINTKGPGKAVAVQADLSTLAGGSSLVKAGLKAFGRLDILVLNAGINGTGVLQDIDEKLFDSVMNMNVKVPLFMVKEAAQHITEGGRIVFLSTSLTVATGVLPNALTYVASKGAIEQAARSLAKDLGARGITVNVVSPGPTDTDLFREGKTEQMINTIAGFAPAKRLGQVEEIAPVVAFLASPKAGWVNGQNIPVNGGFTV